MPRQTTHVDETYLKKIGHPYKIGTVKKVLKNYVFLSGRSRTILSENFMPKSSLAALVGKNVALVGPDREPIGIYIYVEDYELHWRPRIVCYKPKNEIINLIDSMIQIELVKLYVSKKIIPAADGEILINTYGKK
jgi:hypothetical protein